jgi:hypothetical protein
VSWHLLHKEYLTTLTYSKIALLGNADDIVLYLCRELDWQLPPPGETIQSTSNQSARLYPPRVNLKKRASAEDPSETRDILPPRRVGER